MQKLLALLYYKLGIGVEPEPHPDIKYVLGFNSSSSSDWYIDNIVYWGGPDNIVRVFYKKRFKQQQQYAQLIPDNRELTAYFKEIPLKDKSHYDIAILFEHAYLNRAIVEPHDGYDTNITKNGEVKHNHVKYPHPFIEQVNHPDGSCWVQAVKYKIFGIDII